MDTTTLALFKKLESRIRDVDIRQGGPRGPKGRKGDRGLSGATGAHGDQGPSGTKGSAGPTGQSGPQGLQGRSGTDGLQGPTGATGSSGHHGHSGSDGADGVGVRDANIDFDGHLTLHLTDGTELDAGQIGIDSEGQTVIAYSGGIPDSFKQALQKVIDDLNDHLADLNNPHEVSHDQLIDSATSGELWPDKHHNELHDLNSHTDVALEFPVKEAQGLWYDSVTDKWINRVALEESWPTGLAQGGELNIVAATDVEVIDGVGVLTDSYTDPLAPPTTIVLSWEILQETITAAPAVAGSIVWISIYDTGISQPASNVQVGGLPHNEGAIHQYAVPPSPALGKAEIFLGVLLHNGVEWKEVSNPKVVNQTSETLREYVVTVFGPSYIVSGGQVSELPSFELEQAEGVIWENNRNWHVDKADPNREALPARSPLSFQYVNRDFTDVGVATSTVDPTMWDNAGTVEAVNAVPNTATIQRLYLDLADNFWVLWGQKEYPNFLSAQANLPAESVDIPFLLQNSILLGYIVVERGKNDWDVDEAVFIASASASGVGGGGTPITEFITLSDTPVAYSGERTAVPSVNVLETQLNFTYRNRFIANYVGGPTYYPQQWVSDVSFIAICNTETQEPAFPIPVGPLTPIYPDNPPFQEASNTSQVRSGYITTFTKSGDVRSIEVWIPEVTADTHYTVAVILAPNGIAPDVSRLTLANADLTAGEWNTVALGSVLALAGEEVLVYLESQNFGGSTQVTGGWRYDGLSQNNAPGAEGWNTNNAQTILRIDKTDLNTTDRTAELMGIISGSTVQFVETAVPTNIVEYLTASAPVDSGTYVSYVVQLLVSTGTIPVSAVSTMTADIPIAQPTKFVFEPDKFLNETIPWADFESFLEYDDVLQPVDSNIGYGINFNFQQLEQSEDWNLIPLGSGGGGGGVSDHNALNNITPNDHHNRLDWIGSFIDGPTYLVGDMTTEQGFLAVCNTDTNEGPAPDIIGPPTNPTDGATFVSAFQTNLVETGNVFTMALTVVLADVVLTVLPENTGLAHTVTTEIDGEVEDVSTVVPLIEGPLSMGVSNLVIRAGSVLKIVVGVVNNSGPSRVYWEEDNDYWLTFSNLHFTDVTGVKDDVADDTAYGISISAAEVLVSDDWDMLAAPVGVSVGGIFNPTIFAGAGTEGYVPDPIIESGRMLKDDGLWSSIIELANGNVGIGEAAPDRKVIIQDGDTGTGLVVKTARTSNGGGIACMDSNTTSDIAVGIRASGDSLFFRAGTGNRMTLSSSGNLTVFGTLEATSIDGGTF